MLQINKEVHIYQRQEVDTLYRLLYVTITTGKLMKEYPYSIDCNGFTYFRNDLHNILTDRHITFHNFGT